MSDFTALPVDLGPHHPCDFGPEMVEVRQIVSEKIDL